MDQEGIPSLRRAKRTTRGIPTENQERHNLVACINVMHGTLLKLYPLGAKRPIFTARLAVFRRLRALMQDTVDKMSVFRHTEHCVLHV